MIHQSVTEVCAGCFEDLFPKLAQKNRVSIGYNRIRETIETKNLTHKTASKLRSSEGTRKDQKMSVLRQAIIQDLDNCMAMRARERFSLD
ncbi:hypothetical protein Fmac_025202 [Flemingia macrophylla]|uniref:Uncharacterized protein n=1 Tax=Flemingia macrophylla TaxID=520843 RepID=A0ABD1LRK8_9FABA